MCEYEYFLSPPVLSCAALLAVWTVADGVGT